MGCGASKNLPEQVAMSNLAPPPPKPEKPSIVNTQAPLPAIQSRVKPVAFEIPLDGLVEKRVSLPKLTLSAQDIQARLADTEARWKVGKQLDQLLVEMDDKAHRKKGDKPRLRSKHEQDPELIKKRLQEKIELATLNRQREIERLQAKLALQEERARKVQERKKQLGQASTEELRLSIGDKQASQDSNFPIATSRGGSGRSVLSDTTEVEGRESIQLNPLKQATTGLQYQLARHVS